MAILVVDFSYSNHLLGEQNELGIAIATENLLSTLDL